MLIALRDRLRCKEIWVVGADKWRNPDDDLPADFEAKRAAHYHQLGLPLDATAFASAVKAEMSASSPPSTTPAAGSVGGSSPPGCLGTCFGGARRRAGRAA